VIDRRQEVNMMRKKLGGLSKAVALIFLASLVQIGMAADSKQTIPPAGKQAKTLDDRIKHSILMLPYYGVFDDIGYKLQGDTVTLVGEVRRPFLKDDADQAVRKIDGIAKVVNNIEVLPLSPMDDSLRWMTYKAIYSRPGFEKYGLQSIKPIKIIVKNGNIPLMGAVGSEFDKIEAEMAAKSVPFAFSVKDELIVG
jgi:hyperosmotically inducible periplasmic protein